MAAEGSGTQKETHQVLTSKDASWVPVTPSESLFRDYLHDWDDTNLDLGQSVNGLPLVFPLPEIQDTQSASRSTDCLEKKDGCRCMSCLADILERISGGSSGNVDDADRFDDLLIHLRDGVEMFEQVLLCQHCSVCSTISMFVMTVASLPLSENNCPTSLLCISKIRG